MSALLELRWPADVSFAERRATAEKLGEAFAAVLREVGREMGHKVRWDARVAEWACDGEGCDRRTRDLERWTRRDDGADLCPECSA